MFKYAITYFYLMFAKKSQYALEYLLIIGVIFAMILPTVFLFYTYASDTNLKIENSQANEFLEKVVGEAERVHYLGPPSKITLNQKVPESTYNISVQQLGSTYLLRISLRSKAGTSNISRPSRVPIVYNQVSPYLGPGTKRILLESVSSGGLAYVNITLR